MSTCYQRGAQFIMATEENSKKMDTLENSNIPMTEQKVLWPEALIYRTY